MGRYPRCRLNVSMLTSHLGRSYASRSLRGVYLTVFSASVSWRDSSPLSFGFVNSMIRRHSPPPVYCPCVWPFMLYPPFSVSFLHFQLHVSQFIPRQLPLLNLQNQQPSALHRCGNVWRHLRCLSTTVVLGCDVPGCLRP